MEIWQTGFSDHRVRDFEDYRIHVGYIYRNPVGKKLAKNAADYPYCSAHSSSLKDEVSQWLKPLERQLNGVPKGTPLQEEQLSSNT